MERRVGEEEVGSGAYGELLSDVERCLEDELGVFCSKSVARFLELFSLFVCRTIVVWLFNKRNYRLVDQLVLRGFQLRPYDGSYIT